MENIKVKEIHDYWREKSIESAKYFSTPKKSSSLHENNENLKLLYLFE
jgi:hypothetical protein